MEMMGERHRLRNSVDTIPNRWGRFAGLAAAGGDGVVGVGRLG